MISTPSRAHGDAVTPEEFRGAFRQHAAGVALITAEVGGVPVALTATSVSSVSAAPPVLVMSLSAQSSSAATVRRAATVVVHLLGAGQLDLARLGAAPGVDRFADRSRWARLATGEPYFPAARIWIRGRVVGEMPAGGSSVVAVEALQTNAGAVDTVDECAPLVYHDRAWHRLGAHSRIA